MNDSTQAMDIDAPRRSGRERRQAESVYADARLVERKKMAAMNDSKRSDRSMRYRKRKAEEEDDDEEGSRLDIFSDEEEEEPSSDSEEEEGINSERVKPPIHNRSTWYHLGRVRLDENPTIEQLIQMNNIENAFVSGDGDKLYCLHSYYWTRSCTFTLSWHASGALAAAQKSLVAEQDQHSISLEHIFHRDSIISQVPYHADMMLCYDYFAEGIQRHTSLESFKIVNFNLPQSPWLQNKIFTVLEQNSNLASLELSNCFLSADDLTSLTKFVDGNETLSSLNISHTNIQSESTVKALAKALKKHPALRSVNLTYCNFAGGSKMMDKILAACKKCESLEIGHGDFDSENVAVVAKFLAKKHSLTSFSLVGAAVDNDNKKLLSDALMQNRTIEKLCLHSNQLQLPAVIRGTKEAIKALSRLTHLDLSFNKLSLSGAKSMAKFLAGEDSKLISLVMMKNNLTSKGANVLLSSVKKNTTLQHLDLSRNWITNKSVPAVIDLLKNNSTLVTLDLSVNKGLKTVEKRAVRRWGFVDGRYQRDESRSHPQVDGGRTKIVKDALFDTFSLESIISSNHTCAVFMTGFNHNDSTRRQLGRFCTSCYSNCSQSPDISLSLQINALDANEGRKIRLKFALARYANDDKKAVTDLLDLHIFDDLSLELMPALLEMLQEAIGFNGLGNDVVTGWMKDRDKDKTSPYARKVYAQSLSLLFDTIKSWQSLPLLFARGPGDFCFDVPAQTEAKRKKKKMPQKPSSSLSLFPARNSSCKGGLVARQSAMAMIEQLPSAEISFPVKCKDFIPLLKRFEGGFAEIGCLVVNKDYRKGGRGDAMLGYLERLSLQCGARKVFVLSTQTMDWFIERGFREVSVESLPPSRQALYNKKRKSKIYMKEIDDADMMPCYNYFAEGIQSYTSLESFKIVNFNLPQSPWLQNKIFPVLEQNRNLTALQLSNCFLSAADLTSLTKFVEGNETLSLLNISHTNIQSESTVKALAKALKKHPALRSVNLTYCNFAGGSKMMDKILAACKKCESLEIGHGDFDSENVAAVAKFLAKKHSLTSFSLVGAAVDNDNKKLLSEALMQNKTIEKLCLHSNQLQLPAVIRGTKEAMKALSRLTHLDLSFNKLSISGAKSMAKFLAGEDSKLISLVMMKNNLTSKGANVLLSSVKKNTTLQHLDLSRNWITNKSVPAVIDLLKNNSTLVTLDLSGNKGLKTVEKRAFRGRYVYNYADGRYRYDQSQARPQVDGGRTKIVKDALFDTCSLESIISSNHTCAVFMTGFNHNDSYEETIRKINALDANEGRKIRLKIALARYANDDKKGVTDLLDPHSFDDLSLELMPSLLEMLQEAIGFNGLGNDVVTGWMKDRDKDKTSPYARKVYAKSLSLLFDTIKSWQSLPLLFARGPGDFCFDVPAHTDVKVKKKKKPQKRRKFGTEEDGEDDAWLPKGARKTGKHERNPETGKWEFVPPPVY
ncbi:leucine-rich repeat protein [Skeletonema marinoi]|uniref:Leucine-rich repeat protein n=1 Tax=Skeletonema marinoi TaxID=267567 RepID=A0AAD8YAD8_9STRA|nr:leucine-rich repeat protein [Skeletonema marinoi]